MSKIMFQVLSALILHCSCLNLGIVFTWPSSTLMLFQSEETPLHRPMVESELALLGSFSSIGALVSNPLTGIFLDRLGRKRCALITAGICAEARKSLAFYRNTKPDSKVVLQEVLKIKRALATEEQEIKGIKPEEEMLNPAICEKIPVEKPNFIQFFKKSKSTQRALLVSMTLMTAAIFQGLIVVIVYAKPLFSKAVPEEILSATWCSVIFAAVSVGSGLIAAYLTDLTGRRTLMITSTSAVGLCCIGLGTQIHLGWGPEWLTAILMYFYCASYSIGSGTVPYVLLAELFLPEVKSVIAMVVLEWTWLCNFAILFIFNPLVAAIGLGPIFYMFATVSFSSAIFCVFFLPETKGLTVDAIQLLFVKQKRNSVI